MGIGRVQGVRAFEVGDYVYGGYRGDFPSPPHADGNPRRAVIVAWEKVPYRFVFSHEASDVPWIELPSGAAACFQMFEGNEGWAELFNQYGRLGKNSAVELRENGPDRVWIRWTYTGVNMDSGEPAYRGSEDFWMFPSGLILRRQSYQALRTDTRGHAREPIELIGMCPVGKRWFDVLEKGPKEGEHHALAVLDAYSEARYDVYWKHRRDTLWKADARREGADWKVLDDSAGVVMALPLKGAAPFVVIGEAAGFGREFTRIKEHSHKDTGSHGWKALTWDHWPIGSINSQSRELSAETLNTLPSHFAPAGLDLWDLPNEKAQGRDFYSLMGVGSDLEEVRALAWAWLEGGPERVKDLRWVGALPALTRSKR